MQRILLLLATALCCSAMRLQAVGVTGRLMCGSKPASNVRVKLWEEDEGPDPDDLLDQGYTNATGHFRLQGSERETTTIEPVFKVYHDCDDEMKPGHRKVKFYIPSSYISSGKTPKRMYDIGVVNLQTTFAKEERDYLRA
ncbi:Transthyretin-like family protein [Oesophagostomum dentatum]|uniref:Transthyretin-like family protein n=1 Tax=Oesophagostomum dentatum TaxID=61180 RepID=A0A0B1TAV0_OESDE|nr:Transthyretin-like family protein [Oesophagostomum dentatum]